MREQPILVGFAWWEIFIAGISTLAIFSFLYRENPFYRFFEHLYIGIATGIGIMATLQTFLWPQVLKPMFGFDRTVVWPNGADFDPATLHDWPQFQEAWRERMRELKKREIVPTNGGEHKKNSRCR